MSVQSVPVNLPVRVGGRVGLPERSQSCTAEDSWPQFRRSGRKTMAASVRLLPLLLCGCVVLAWHVLAQGAPPEEVSLPSARPASKVQSAAIFPRHLEQTTCGMVMLRGDQLLAASGHSLRKWTA